MPDEPANTVSTNEENVAEVEGRVEVDYTGQVRITSAPALDQIVAQLADHEQRLRNLEQDQPPPPSGVRIDNLHAVPQRTEAFVGFDTNLPTFAFYELHDKTGIVATWAHQHDPTTEHGHVFATLTPNTQYNCEVTAWEPGHEGGPTDNVVFTTLLGIPPIDPPPEHQHLRYGINMSLGGYTQRADSAGYWYSSTPRDITRPNIQHMMHTLGINHIRGNYSPQWETNADRIIDHLDTILAAGCTVTLANHSWCTGADPSNHDRVMQAFRRIITAGSNYINQAIRDNRFRIQPWNEPSGHATYKGGFEASVTHSDRWIGDHTQVMDPLLSIAPDLGFDLGEPHGGNGGRRPDTSCNAYYGPTLLELGYTNLRADIHKYQGWQPGYAPDFANMRDNHWPYPVSIGEFGGDPYYERRGKGPNHHSNVAYPSAQDLIDHWTTYTHNITDIAMWHAYQAWTSGFTLSDKHNPQTKQGRYAPWEIDDHPRTLIGGQYLDRITAAHHNTPRAHPDPHPLTRLADET